jgi:hypothetical protein
VKALNAIDLGSDDHRISICDLQSPDRFVIEFAGMIFGKAVQRAQGFSALARKACQPQFLSAGSRSASARGRRQGL